MTPDHVIAKSIAKSSAGYDFDRLSPGGKDRYLEIARQVIVDLRLTNRGIVNIPEKGDT